MYARSFLHFPPVNVHDNAPEVGSDDKNAEGDEQVMRGADHVLEHHQQEGGAVEGGHHLHQDHGERVGEEQEEEEQEEQGKARQLSRLSYNWANGLKTPHSPEKTDNVLPRTFRNR